MSDTEKRREFLLNLSGLSLFKSGELLYRLQLGYMPGMPQSGVVYKPDASRWERFWEEIDELGVFNWNEPQAWAIADPEREGAAACGVSHLRFAIIDDENIAICKGASNRYPPNWIEFWACVERLFSPEFERINQEELDRVKSEMLAAWEAL